MKLVLATRGSKLALWQANETKRLLITAHPELDVELNVVHSAGDQDAKTELARFGLTGIFTAEIDHAVLSRAAHAGVHSLKDVPTTLHDDLVLASCLERASPEDVIVSRAGATLADLQRGARVATGSVRRVAMIKRLRPDLEVIAIRGNVDTRIRKLLDGEADALVMARAGLERIGLEKHISEVLDVDRSVPAPGQGIVGISCRRDDERTRTLLAEIDDAYAHAAALAERALLHGLHGGCNVPVGGHARVADGALSLHARVLSIDGREQIEDRATGAMNDAAALGANLALRLIARGAQRLIESARAR